MHLLAKWLIAATSIVLAAYFVPGIHVVSFYSALAAAFILGILSITIKPIVKLITLPLTMLTLGLFSLVINALFFWFVGNIVKGFYVNGFTAAFIGALIVSIVNFISDKLMFKDEEEDVAI